MNGFLERLKSGILICDGAMGTQLMNAGLQPGECSEAWNLENPDEILKIQRSYASAGADIIISNTFGANRWTLARHGKESQLEIFNIQGVELARKAIGGDGFVAGGMGPTGELPEPYGDKRENDFTEIFAEQARVLHKAGADFIIIETVSAPEELASAVKAVKRETPLPVCASASFSSAREGTDYRTMMGASIETMVESALSAGADIVGANCGDADIEDMAKIALRIRKITDAFIIIEPNAGRPVVSGGSTIYTQSADEMAKHVGVLIDAGVNIIGGCCGTTPAHISAIARLIKS